MKRISLIFGICVLLLSCILLSSCDSIPDKSELFTCLEQMRATSKYTTASYNAYKDAYAEAKEVYYNDDATYLEIDNAIKNLKDKYSKLKELADFSELSLAIGMHTTIDPNGYTKESYNTYLATYNSALSVYNNDESSQNEINSAVTSLNNAIRSLVRIPDNSTLQQLLQQTFEESMYTGASYAIYKEAYDSALALVQASDTTKSEILLAEKLLEQAIAGLVVRGDGTALSEYLSYVKNVYLVNDAKGRTPEQYYSPASYADFKSAYEKATMMVLTGDASDEQISAMHSLLQNTAVGLVNIGGLKDRIELITGYSEISNFYTEESYDVLVNAASAVINTVNDRAPSAEEVANIERTFDAAVLGLKRREVTADERMDKKLTDKMIVIGNSSVSLEKYLEDYSAFFLQVLEENPSFSFYYGDDGDLGEVYFAYGKTEIMLNKNGIGLIYNGRPPVSSEDQFAASFGGICFSDNEFDVSSEEKFGAPSQYSKYTENVAGDSITYASLTYYDEYGNCMIVIYDTIQNYIKSIYINV